MKNNNKIYYESILKKYINKGILIDTNLLLLFLIGSFDKKAISTFKRLENQGYDEKDFLIVSNIMRASKKLITTPNILTEISNLSFQFKYKIKEKYNSFLLKTIENFNEIYINSNSIKEKDFSSLGLTDSIILKLSDDCLIVTDDAKLCSFIEHKKKDFINLNHLRMLNL